jgi:hypothetical protein
MVTIEGRDIILIYTEPNPADSGVFSLSNPLAVTFDRGFLPLSTILIGNFSPLDSNFKGR